RRELGRLLCYQLHHARAGADYRFGPGLFFAGRRRRSAKLARLPPVLGRVPTELRQPMQSLSSPRDRRARARAALAGALALLAVGAGALTAGRAEGAPSQKNVIFILTDDMTSSELAGMPNVMSEIVGQGTTFNRGYISFPLCCPSRATMMSGQYMH